MGRLIDRFAETAAEGVGTESIAWAHGFLAVDQDPQFGGGVLGAPKPVVSPVMRELVRRGVDAIPDLLAHLDDARETRLVVGSGGIITLAWHSNEYRPRGGRGTPEGVSTSGMGPELKKIKGGYRIRVGDLCFVAIGQIVNRGLRAARYQPSGCLVINSPVETPALAAAVRLDWVGVTKEQHMEGLWREAVDNSGPWTAQNAIVRLLFYYPRSGEELAVKLLQKPPSGCALEDFVRALHPYRLPSLDVAVLEVARRYAQVPGPIKLEQGDVARACAERLSNSQYDPEFVPYFKRWLTDLKGEREGRADEGYRLGAPAPRIKWVTDWLERHGAKSGK